MLINETIKNNKNEKINLTNCFDAQGSIEPPAAEYKRTNPIKNIIHKSNNKK